MDRTIIIFFASLALLPSTVFARTELFLEGPTDVRPGTEFPVTLKARIDQSINAVEVALRFDPIRMNILTADTRDSVVRLWLKRPSPSPSGTVTMEGIIPGGVGPGFTDVVVIARFTIKTPLAGATTMDIINPIVYLNQPDPRPDAVSVRPLTIRVREDAPAFSVRPLADVAGDIDVRLIREPLIHDGDWALVFDVRTEQETATVLVRERTFGLWGTWREAVTPYRLSDQSLTSILEVAVADDTGTHVVRTIVPERLVAIYILVAVLLGVVAYRRLGRRKKRR